MPLNPLEIQKSQNFKSVNDRHGHQVGDQVLQELGQLFHRTLREIDFAGRIGGEEFAVILPQTGHEQAFDVAERLRCGVEQTEIPLEHGIPIVFTISIGVTTSSGTSLNIDTLLARADKALYEAKDRGRNRSCIFGAG